jgi:L-alanine-DL-glutamate epimerase-like enolase superfamily enzyme
MVTATSIPSKTHERVAIDHIVAVAFQVPTDVPESDGTLAWDSTMLVSVHVDAGGQTGFGYTYAPAAAASLINEVLTPAIMGHEIAVERCWQSMVRTARNVGVPGLAACAISAVDVALWDLKAKLLELPIVELWGSVRNSVPIYGSGGFTSYNDTQLRDQLSKWAIIGIDRVKMKVGRDASDDPRRVLLARRAIGDQVELFVDANGAYNCKQALKLAEMFHDQAGVVWFEEPRPSDDLECLRLLRDRAPAGMDIAAGEYGYTPDYFRRMLSAGAVDCLQADVTRCGGFTGFRKIAALCEAFHIPLSAHCAPQLHAAIGCCVAPVRLAALLFEGVEKPDGGRLQPNTSRPGIGFELKQSDAEQYRIAV